MFCKNCGKEIVGQADNCPQCGVSLNLDKATGEVITKKTKLGLSIGAFAALTFLSGLVSFLVLALMAGYALAFEEDKSLKKNVVKAVIFVLFIAVITAIVGSIDNVLAAINGLMNSIKAGSGDLHIPLGLDGIILNIFDIIEKLGLIILAFKAFKGNDLKIPVVDDYVNKSL